MARMPKVALPASTPSDSPLVSICVNRDWLSIMHTCLTRLEWGASWREGTDIDQAEQMTFELYDRLRNISSCGNDMARLRQNPNNSCQLQQSFDGGITWELAFDFSKCRPKPDRITEQNFYNQTLEVYESVMNLYDGSVTSVAPDMVYTGDEDENAIRDTAVCYAIHQLVAWACEIEIERRQNDAIIGNIVSATLGLVAGLVSAGIILSTAGTGTAIGFGVGSAIVGIGATLWDGIAEAVLRNATAREKVACCLYNAIKGQTPTATLFENGLNGCNFAFGSPEAQLAGAIGAVLGQDDVHATFLKYTSDNLRFAELGLIDCPCPTVTWEHTFDFRTQNTGTIHRFCTNPDSPVGIWVNGSGYQSVGNIRSPQCAIQSGWRIVEITVPLANDTSTITGIEFEYNATTLGAPFTQVAVWLSNRTTGGTELDTIFFTTPTLAGINTAIWEGSQAVTHSRMKFRVWVGSNGVGTAFIRRATVRGTGTNPFI